MVGVCISMVLINKHALVKDYKKLILRREVAKGEVLVF